MKRNPLETALRRIELYCRQEQKAFGPGYHPNFKSDILNRGARAEARGVCLACEEVRTLCRQMRKQFKKKKGGG